MDDASQPRPYYVPPPRVELPRVYRASRSHWVVFGSLGVLSIAGGLAFAVWMLIEGAPLPALMMLALFGGAGGVLLASLGVARLELHADAIVVRELGRGTRRVAHEDIVGRRVDTNAVFILVLREGKAVPCTFMPNEDELLRHWLSSVPDLDVSDYLRSRQEVLASVELGPTPEGRAEELSRASRNAWVLGLVALATGGYLVWRNSEPPPLVELLVGVLPLTALLLLATGRGLYSVSGEFHGARAKLFAPLCVGAVLEWRVLLESNFVDRWTLIAIGSCIGVVMAIAAAVFERPKRARDAAGLALLLTLFLAPYGTGALSIMNERLDRGVVEQVEVYVRAPYACRDGTRAGRTDSPSRHLTLSAGGPFEEAHDVRVPAALAEQVEAGDRVCLLVHPGALGARWVEVERACDHGGQASAALLR